MSDAAKPAAPTEAPPPAKSSNLMPILVGLNSLLLFGVLGFMGYTITHPPAPPPPAHEAAEEHDASAKEEKAEAPKKEEAKAEKAEKGEKAEKKEGQEAHAAPTTGPGPMVRLSDFVIHLRNPELDRYARMSFDIEVIAEPDKERLNAHLPRVRDAIITYLSDRTLEELRGSEGLTRTKDALQQKLRELVPEARIRALYISDFVVQ